jgi:hypothetical protein
MKGLWEMLPVDVIRTLTKPGHMPCSYGVVDLPIFTLIRGFSSLKLTGFEETGLLN